MRKLFVVIAVAFATALAFAGGPATSRGTIQVDPATTINASAVIDGGVTITNFPLSAFGAMAVTSEAPDIVLAFAYNNVSGEKVSTFTDGGATIYADGGRVVLNLPATDGSYAELSSRLSGRYYPGQGMTCRFTLVSSGCVAKQQLEVGCGDTRDGFYIGCCPSCLSDGGSSFALLRRARGAETWYVPSAWNGGWGATPPDPTFGRPYQIVYQWLGYGQVTYYAEDVTSGTFVPLHAVKYAGTSTETTIENPTLKLRIAARNLTNTAGWISSPSMSLIRQGVLATQGNRTRKSARSGPRVLNTTTETAVLSIRNDAAFNGLTNRAEIIVDSLSWGLNGANQDAWIGLVRLGHPVDELRC